MMLSGGRCLTACQSIDVLTTELLATFEAPGFATAMVDLEGLAAGRESTGKNIVAGGVL